MKPWLWFLIGAVSGGVLTLIIVIGIAAFLAWLKIKDDTSWGD